LAQPDADERERRELFQALHLLGTIGIAVVLAVTAAVLAGLYIGERFGLGLAPVVVAVLLAVAASFLWVYRKLTRHLDTTGGPPAAPDPGEQADAE
jgi:hypothetical protein